MAGHGGPDRARIPAGLPGPTLQGYRVETIGAFQIRKPLGRGVSGVVYEAYNPIRGVVGAVKVFTEVTNRTPALKTRLLRDAQAAAALQHPNLASVLESGEDQGHPYVVAEYVEGVDLAQVLRSRKPFPVEWVLDLWRQMCEGLAHAHRAQLLHLDLKPSDVRVTPAGEVKLVDFGVHHLKSLERSNGPAVGGVHYRAPEQVEGRKPDPRADVFSAAAIVYELLARRRAFPGEDLTTVLTSITRGRADPSALPATGFSPGLEELVLRAMARDPRDRPDGFEELHAGLVALVRGARSRIQAQPSTEEEADAAAEEAATAPERERLLTELYLARSEDHMQRGLDICRRLLELDPEDETARRAAREIEALVQDREVEQLVGLALSYAADGDTELATKIAEKVERVAPWSPRYLQLQVYLDEVAARQTVDRLVATARQALNYDRTEEARSAAEQALSLLPGYPAAQKLMDELAAGDPSTETASIAATEDSDSDPGFEGALRDVPEASAEPAVAAAVEDHVALPGLDSGSFPTSSPQAASARPIARQVESLTSAALRHFVGNDHGKARQAVEKALALDPGNRRALELQKILGALG
jgi:serine/threonine protein kinase